MLHDNKNLFLYQKHSKMRILNVPVFYSPYLVTPSPLRKERKSGFLTPSISLNFFDTRNSQSNSFPYYFNLDIDKELTFTPSLRYGAGVDSSQRFKFDYNQILSGGLFSSILSFDTTFENQNNEKWLKEGSIINTYKQNINEKFRIDISSTLQTAKNYIQQTNPNDELSYSSSLSSKLNLNGYNLYKEDDLFLFNITNYQSNQDNEDNKILPTIFPYATYYTGIKKLKKYDYSNTFEAYNIFRDTPTDIHAKKQTKLASAILINKKLIKFGNKINYGTEIHNQFFNTENIKINGEFKTGNYLRTFPIFGIRTAMPFKLVNNFKNLTYTPNLSLVIAPGASNSNKISNEDSSINSYTIDNNNNFNRYTGSDKLDNSKRLDLSFNINNEKFRSIIASSYEFTNNSNYHYSQGNEKKLSDLMGEVNLNIGKSISNYKFRFDPHKNYMKNQNYIFKYSNSAGEYSLSYLDEKKKTEDVLTIDKETINYKFDSKKFKYSKISYFGLYDLNKSINTESGLLYSYFDECFGLNIDFKRNSYAENDLKPQDIMTVMLSFKNLGSYKSTNLITTGEEFEEKQVNWLAEEIKWESESVSDELFD